MTLKELTTLNHIRCRASIILMDYELSVKTLVEQMRQCTTEQLFREDTLDEARHVLELLEHGMTRTIQHAMTAIALLRKRT